MARRFGAAAGALLLAASAVGMPRALAAGGVARFASSDWRLTLTGESGDGAMTLVIRGKAAAHGNEYLPFRWKVPDARPYLPVLQACSSGQLQGQVRLEENRDDKPIDGLGPLLEISCFVETK